ncbi:rhomboid-like protein [Streptomyces sp. NRRL F-4489]|uniref:rhomboid-like protein n=1 Tax=Streptomyces sp. NRRL F-4489 TaxID=1609095 RepID=UPI000AE8C285|nr:rhomboid-like protein [Streptomyces sp. NRRL F-4489]
MVAIRVRDGGGWRGALPWAAPLYVAALQAGAYATARLPGPRRTELLRRHSTNTANLDAGRWGTLATSAGFVEEPLPAAYGAALLAALAAAEARWGTARTAAVFAAGHVGASLLVYAGLRARGRWRGRPVDESGPVGRARPVGGERSAGGARSVGWGRRVGGERVAAGARGRDGAVPEAAVPAIAGSEGPGSDVAVTGLAAQDAVTSGGARSAHGATAHDGATAHETAAAHEAAGHDAAAHGAAPLDAVAQALDVGASYGFCAVLGALGATWGRPRVRVAVVGGLVGLGIAPVVRRGRTFTDAGHLAALVLGVGIGAARNGIRGRFPATWPGGAIAGRAATPVW